MTESPYRHVRRVAERMVKPEAEIVLKARLILMLSSIVIFPMAWFWGFFVVGGIYAWKEARFEIEQELADFRSKWARGSLR